MGEHEIVNNVSDLHWKLLEILGRDTSGGVPHDHTTYVAGCFRCDLNRDELGLDSDDG